MVLDTKNRIWIQCRNGQLSLLDEKRVFHAINIREKGKKVTIDYLLPPEDKTMFLSGGRIFELLETDSIHFAPVQMQEDPLFRNTFKRINRWEKNRLVFSGNDLLFFFDSKTLKKSKPIRVPFITAAVKRTEEHKYELQ